MIHLNNISLAFGGQRLLDDLSWHIKPDTRIGLIGPNGAGKSTLLKIIAGRQNVDDGTISMAGTTTVGYLSQDVQEVAGRQSVLEEALKAFEEVKALEKEEHEIVTQLDGMGDHESDAYHRLLHRLERVHAMLHGHNADRAEARTKEVLTGLGFEPDSLERPLDTFSGGWRMRVTLAKLLLRRPDVLLLDEPTNHLDIESIDWVEQFLTSYEGTVVLVSHDRYFLDRMVTEIAELANGKVTEYAGNYAYYLEARQERRAIQQAAYENQQKWLKDTERFIERFRAKATKARQVQSRVKLLEKTERLVPPPSEAATINFRFPEPSRSGRVVLELSRFSKVYEQQNGERTVVFRDAGPLAIERGDKIALIGKNGAGKSTLARMIIGREPFEGTRKLGHNVDLTYFAQQQAESLNHGNTILEELKQGVTGQTETQVRSLLGAFLFSGDDVFKPISVLSGGEKSRVALARTLLAPANFLVLDEPTNHLDIQSIRVLIEALRQFSGTLVVVSHDRHFLDQVANKVWHADHGLLREFPGTYSEYRWSMEEGALSRQDVPEAAPHAADSRSRPPREEAPRVSGPKTKEQKRREAEERNRKYKEAAPGGDGAVPAAGGPQAKKQLAGVEQKIARAEERKSEVEAMLADPEFYADGNRSAAIVKEYNQLETELAELYRRWENLAESVAEG